MSLGVQADPLAAFDVRPPTPADHGRILAVLDDSWAGKLGPDEPGAQEALRLQRVLLVPRLYLEHFASTSLLVERDGRLVGFLIGFLSQDHDDQAYVHFVGVDPELRGRGLGRALYERFFDLARAAGRREVRCITSPGNTGSLAFHRAMGFRLEPGDEDVGGVPVVRDYDGPGLDRVAFVKELSPPERAGSTSGTA